MKPFIVMLCAVVTLSAAPARFSAYDGTAVSPLLVFVYGSEEYAYYDEYPKPADYTVSEDYQRRGLDRSPAERLEIIDRLIKEGHEVKDAVLYCFPLLKKRIESAKAEIDREAVESEIRFLPDSFPMFEIKRSEAGRKVDEEQVYNDVYFALKRGLKRVALSVRPVLPEKTAEKLSAYTRLRSEFSTSYSSSTPERKHNITLALSRINGTVLEAGEVFSFNKIVGKRTAANGFKEAKIIVDGSYTDGVGGGVCQASTTVYNAALMAGMKITAVNRHSLVPTYVEPSFDAMVNGSGSDLKFRNDGDGPVFIRAYTTSTSVCVKFYSSELPYRITRRSVTLSMGERPEDVEFTDTERKYTEGMQSGEKVRVSGGAPAVRSEGWLVLKYPDGKQEERKIRSDNYSSSAGRVAVAP